MKLKNRYRRFALGMFNNSHVQRFKVIGTSCDSDQARLVRCNAVYELEITMQSTTSGFWYELHCCEQVSMTSGTGSESVALKKRLVNHHDHSIVEF